MYEVDSARTSSTRSLSHIVSSPLVSLASVRNSWLTLSLITTWYRQNDSSPRPIEGMRVARMAKVRILLLMLFNFARDSNRGEVGAKAKLGLASGRTAAVRGIPGASRNDNVIIPLRGLGVYADTPIAVGLGLRPTVRAANGSYRPRAARSPKWRSSPSCTSWRLGPNAETLGTNLRSALFRAN